MSVLGRLLTQSVLLKKHLSKGRVWRGAFLMPRIKKRIMNQPVREAIPTPTGWLVSPTREFCMFFIRDPKSEMAFPRVYTQLWYCLEDGTPTKLKNTRRIDLESAIETWHELLTQDWELMEHQINEDAA